MLMTLTALYLFALAIFLVAFVIYEHVQGKCHLLSVRNVAILGFILFQVTSGATALYYDAWGRLFLSNPAATGALYALWATTFLAIALFVYNRGYIANRLARALPDLSAVPGGGTLLMTSIVFSVLAVFFKFVLIYVPVLGILASTVANGLAAVACVLIGWVWARQFLNPVMIMIVGVIFMANFLTVMSGTFGRRGLVAVGAALLWGLYYSHWRHLRTMAMMQRMALVAAGPIVLIALFTAVRGYLDDDRDVGTRVASMREAGFDRVQSGMMDMMAGQHCAAHSMWLMESFPDDFQYRHMASLWHFIIYPVPRAMWEDKPESLGIEMPKLARVEGVDRNLVNLGVGVLGSAAADGGWYALIFYAIFAGIFLRFFDEASRVNGYGPFVVAPMGAALGQVLGLARGETSAFAALTVLSVAGTLFFMIAIHYVVARAGWTIKLAEENDEFDDLEDVDEYGDPYDDGPWQDEFGNVHEGGYVEAWADDVPERV